MAWEEADYIAVEAAIRAVRDGTRQVGISSEGGSKAFMNTPLPELLKLRDEMKRELDASASAAARRPRVFLMRHRRAL